MSNQNLLLSSSSLLLVILFEVDTLSSSFAVTNRLCTNVPLLILPFRLNHLSCYCFYTDHVFQASQLFVSYLKS